MLLYRLKVHLSGGRNIRCSLEAGFASLATVGLVVTVVSGAFFPSALERNYNREDRQSMPLVFAVIGLGK